MKKFIELTRFKDDIKISVQIKEIYSFYEYCGKTFIRVPYSQVPIAIQETYEWLKKHIEQ